MLLVKMLGDTIYVYFYKSLLKYIMEKVLNTSNGVIPCTLNSQIVVSR